MAVALATVIPAPTNQHSHNGIGTVTSNSAISSLTRSGGVATATTTAPHGLAVNANDTPTLTIAGATPTDYNGTVVCAVTGASTFTYAIASTVATPATGTITFNNNQISRGTIKLAWATWVANKKLFEQGLGADPGNFTYSGLSYS